MWPSAQTIRNWLRRAERDDGRRGDGPASAEREELRGLRREHTVRREEHGVPEEVAVCECLRGDHHVAHRDVVVEGNEIAERHAGVRGQAL